MAKVIGIVGSPRIEGNTEILVAAALRSAEEAGKGTIQTELIRMANYRVEPCDGCESCRKLGYCKIEDDFEVIFQKMVEADGIVIGSPVYFSSPTPNILALLHRAGYVSQSKSRPFERKVGAPIAVARRAGQNFVLAQLLFFFLHQGMIVPGSTYWNMAIGREPGDVLADAEGMATMRNFGQNLAWTMEKTMAESAKPA